MSEPIRYDYSGSMEDVELSAGKYLFECYGAKAGSTDLGGKGGYSAGEIEFSEDVTIHIFIGGFTNNSDGGYNGGGGGPDVFGGGGGTDIRINGTAISNRIIVAGGAGGASVDASPSVVDGGKELDTNHELFQGYSGAWLRNGGGGGYRGGYAGGMYHNPGEGGSSYVDTELFENIVMTPGVNTGNGYIVITLLSTPKKIRTFAQIM